MLLSSFQLVLQESTCNRIELKFKMQQIQIQTEIKRLVTDCSIAILSQQKQTLTVHQSIHLHSIAVCIAIYALVRMSHATFGNNSQASHIRTNTNR